MFIEKLFCSLGWLDFMNLMQSKALPTLALLHNAFAGIAVCNFSIILENVSYLFGQAVKFAVSFLQILQLQLLSWKMTWNSLETEKLITKYMLLIVSMSEYSSTDWGGNFKLAHAPLHQVLFFDKKLCSTCLFWTQKSKKNKYVLFTTVVK